jgi:site-specific DNA-methyltransferase (cytosine-N4-specific)
MHEFLRQTWEKCYAVLVDGGLMCVNIGDAICKGSVVYPNHARILELCIGIGFTAMPYILWKKPSNRSNAFLGSGMLPPNGIVTQDCEYVLIFRKGTSRKYKVNDPIRLKSSYTKQERNVWFSQVWDVKGVKQDIESIPRRVARFPEEIPRRLIQMFSIEGETVLDPYVGSGTTMMVGRRLKRKVIGFEIDELVCSYAALDLGLERKSQYFYADRSRGILD